MRRQEKQILESELLEEIISRAKVCRIAIPAEPAPYIVPLNFGYQNRCLYFHTAQQGRKIDLLRQFPTVGFEISLDLGIVEGEKACDWSARFQSIIGYGQIDFLETPDDKRMGLDLIMAQYGEGAFSYSEAALKATCLLRLKITEMSGKQSRV